MKIIWKDGRWWEVVGLHLYAIYTKEEVMRIGTKLLKELNQKSDTIDKPMNENTETVDGYACPIDPAELEMCESCQ